MLFLFFSLSLSLLCVRFLWEFTLMNLCLDWRCCHPSPSTTLVIRSLLLVASRTWKNDEGGWLMGWFTGWMVGWLTGWLVAWHLTSGAGCGSWELSKLISVKLMVTLLYYVLCKANKNKNLCNLSL